MLCSLTPIFCPQLGDAVNEENQDVSSMSSSVVLIDNRPPQATNSSVRK
jgi:hypothetical protein